MDLAHSQDCLSIGRAVAKLLACEKRRRGRPEGCARAHVQCDLTFDMLGTPCGVAVYRTPNLRVIGPAVSEIQKMGAHVRTCDRNPDLAVR